MEYKGVLYLLFALFFTFIENLFVSPLFTSQTIGKLHPCFPFLNPFVTEGVIQQEVGSRLARKCSRSPKAAGKNMHDLFLKGTADNLLIGNLSDILFNEWNTAADATRFDRHIILQMLLWLKRGNWRQGCCRWMQRNSTIKSRAS